MLELAAQALVIARESSARCPRVARGVGLASGRAMRLPARCAHLFLLTGLALLGTGCSALSAWPTPGTTTVTSASLATPSPPLALFVIRIADDQLPVAEPTRRAILALEADAEAASRPLTGARDRLSDTLVRSVNDGKTDAAAVVEARRGVVRAAEAAAPTLRATVERLHELLSADARASLHARVTAALGGWSQGWNAHRTAEPAWLASFGAATLPADGIAEDVVATARTWSEDRSRATEAALQDGPLGSARRLALVEKLRSGAAFD